MRSKRLAFLATAILFLFTVPLAACGGSASGNSGPTVNYKGTITIWHQWAGNYLTEKQAIFDKYTRLHPDVKINLVRVPENIIDKSVAAINAGSGPDVIAWVDDSLGKLASSKIIVPLDDQGVSKSYVESTYSKPAAQAVEFGGKVYGVPESVEAITLMYNKALVTADQLPKTTDDMLTFEKTYETQHPGKYGVVWNTTDAYFNAPFFYGFGGYYITEDGKVGLSSDGGIAAAKYIAQYRGLLPKDISYDVASSLFTEGKAAATINGPWSYADYADPTKANINIGFATLPTVPATGKPLTPFVGVKTLFVTKLAQNPALAADVLKFYSNTENQIEMAQKNGEIPANAKAADDASVTSLPAIGGYAAQVKNGTPLPNTPYMSGVWKPAADGLQAMWTGAQTPEQAMQAAQTTAQTNVAGLNG